MAGERYFHCTSPHILETGMGFEGTLMLETKNSSLSSGLSSIFDLAHFLRLAEVGPGSPLQLWGWTLLRGATQQRHAAGATPKEKVVTVW